MEISSLLGFGTKCSEIKVLQKVEKKKKRKKEALSYWNELAEILLPHSKNTSNTS